MRSLASTLVMEPVDTPEKLEAWLKDKPADWSAAMALRIALRVMPIALDPAQWDKQRPQTGLTSALLRALIISWAARNIPAQDRSTADSAARSAAFSADSAAHSAARSADSAARSAARSAAHSAAHSAAFSADSAFLDGAEGEAASRLLLAEPLWLTPRPSALAESWKAAGAFLRSAPENYGYWADWYARRLDGKAQGFALSPDKDIEMNRRLIKADDDWWDRDPALVNADILRWIAELSVPPEPTAADLVQVPIALNFVTNDDCVVRLDPTPVGDAVLQDADAVDRHAEARRLAQALADASSPSLTNRSDVQQFADRYQDALGPTIAELRASATVLHGNSLRRLANLDNEGGALAGPLSDRQQSILHDLLFIHNMLVGLDPYLALRDSVGGGLHKDTASLEINVAVTVIASAKSAGAIDPESADALDEAIKNVPIDAEPGERNRQFSSQSILNVARSIGTFLWTHKGKLLGGAGTTIATGWGGAKWIKANEAWLVSVFEQWPAVVGIIKWIANLMP